MMNWLWNAIGSGAALLVQALLKVIGTFLNSVLVQPLLQIIVLPLLGATLFQPFTLTGSGMVAQVAGAVWKTMQIASVGIALASLVWGAFRMTAGGISGKSNKAEMVEGLGIYALTMAGGYTFLTILLSVANSVTGSLFNLSKGLAALSYNQAAPTGASLTLVVFYTFFQPLLMLGLLGALIWVVSIWVMRQVDLIFYTGLLPVTAALALTGNKQAFKWNWDEAVGAVLSQLAMAVAWWIGWVILGGDFGSASTASPGSQVVHTIVGIAAIFMVGRAPRMLQSITGHQHAGVAGLALGAAGGILMAKGAQTAMRMSTGGQFMRQMSQAKQDKAADTLGSWAQGPSLAERFAGTQTGMQAGRLVSASMSQMSSAGRSVASVVSSGVSAVRRSGVGQAVESRARAVGAGMNTLAGQDTPVGAVAGLAVSGAQGVAAAGRSAAGAVQSAGRAAQSVGKAVISPKVSMGRAMEQSYGAQAASQDAADSRRVAAESASIGPEAVMQRRKLRPEAFNRLMGSTNPLYKPHGAGLQTRSSILFRPGAWQQGTYQRVQSSTPQTGPRQAPRYE